MRYQMFMYIRMCVLCVPCSHHVAGGQHCNFSDFLAVLA